MSEDEVMDPSVLAECEQMAVTWAPVLRALGHPERLLIALWLAGTSGTVRDLERVTGLSQSLVSYHLRELRKAGLVTSAASGRAIGIACPTPASTSWVCSSAARFAFCATSRSSPIPAGTPWAAWAESSPPRSSHSTR